MCVCAYICIYTHIYNSISIYVYTLLYASKALDECQDECQKWMKMKAWMSQLDTFFSTVVSSSIFKWVLSKRDLKTRFDFHLWEDERHMCNAHWNHTVTVIPATLQGTLFHDGSGVCLGGQSSYSSYLCYREPTRHGHSHTVCSLANWKSLFQPAGTTLKYLGPKCRTECPEHRVFEGRNHVLVSCLAAAAGASHKKRFGRSRDKWLVGGGGFCAGKQLTEAKIT